MEWRDSLVPALRQTQTIRDTHSVAGKSCRFLSLSSRQEAACIVNQRGMIPVTGKGINTRGLNIHYYRGTVFVSVKKKLNCKYRMERNAFPFVGGGGGGGEKTRRRFSSFGCRFCLCLPVCLLLMFSPCVVITQSFFFVFTSA